MTQRWHEALKYSAVLCYGRPQVRSPVTWLSVPALTPTSYASQNDLFNFSGLPFLCSEWFCTSLLKRWKAKGNTQDPQPFSCREKQPGLWEGVSDSEPSLLPTTSMVLPRPQVEPRARVPWEAPLGLLSMVLPVFLLWIASPTPTLLLLTSIPSLRPGEDESLSF